MIRSALIALGLSASGVGAGSVAAQGMVPTAPILETCGGVRLTLDPVLVEDMDDAEGLARAGDVISARIGSTFGSAFDYTSVGDGQITVSVPAPFLATVPDLTAVVAPFLEQVEFGFHEVDRAVDTGMEIEPADGRVVLQDMEDPFRSYVVVAAPLLNGDMVRSASQSFDQNNTPAIVFEFTAEGRDIFARYTAENIGRPFAIVLDGQVVSAPIIQSAILGGTGIITGAFTVDDAAKLAAMMQSGALPFELTIVSETTLNGSDPSADFCP